MKMEWNAPSKQCFFIVIGSEFFAYKIEKLYYGEYGASSAKNDFFKHVVIYM